MSADASLLLRKSGSFPNISCEKSRTCLFDHSRALANEKIAESCLAVRRPVPEPLPSTPLEWCDPFPLPLLCPLE